MFCVEQILASFHIAEDAGVIIESVSCAGMHHEPYHDKLFSISKPFWFKQLASALLVALLDRCFG